MRCLSADTEAVLSRWSSGSCYSSPVRVTDSILSSVLYGIIVECIVKTAYC